MRAVLFDLDGTLLDIRLDSFLGRYFDALERAVSEVSDGRDSFDVMRALKDAVGEMMRPHPGRTNRDVFHSDFAARSGIDLDAQWSTFERFYAEVFPGLGSDCAPAPGARKVVETAMDCGLGVAIATNPIFPRAAIDHRLAWAGLSDLEIDVITSYETMFACKPQPEYFRQTAAMLSVEPTQCMMVGDDRYLDMAAADTGMRTFYVGDDPMAHSDFRGGLDDLAELLPRLARA